MTIQRNNAQTDFVTSQVAARFLGCQPRDLAELRASGALTGYNRHAGTIISTWQHGRTIGENVYRESDVLALLGVPKA
jgi:hypothetical protein